MSSPLNEAYRRHTIYRRTVLLVLLMLLGGLVLLSLSAGTAEMSLEELFQGLSGKDSLRSRILWTMRLPRILGAVAGGGALALSGLLIQCLLNNPLASPYTLGISQGAAFGAALAIFFSLPEWVISHASGFFHGSITGLCAFTGAMAAAGVILLLAALRQMTQGSLILAGIALSSLALSGTMLLQYFGDDLQVAAMVFWTFGDVGRITWAHLSLLGFVFLAVWLLAFWRRWDLNALAAGDHVAQSLGISPRTCRFWGMFCAALLGALTVAFMGVIGFVGLMAPHMGRRLLGEEYRFLLGAVPLIGGILLLGADTGARTLFDPLVLPVGIITSFLGAPLFFILLLRGKTS